MSLNLNMNSSNLNILPGLSSKFDGDYIEKPFNQVLSSSGLEEDSLRNTNVNMSEEEKNTYRSKVLVEMMKIHEGTKVKAMKAYAFTLFSLSKEQKRLF